MKYLVFSLYVSLALFALPAFAADSNTPGLNCNGASGTCTYTPLEPLPCPATNPNCQSGNTSLPQFIATVFTILFSLGALIAVGRLTAGGIMYMTSEIANKKTEAKRWIRSSIFGLLLLAGSWLILNTINPQLLNFTFTLPTAGGSDVSNFQQTDTLHSNPPNQASTNNCEKTGGAIKQQADGTWLCDHAGAAYNP